MRSQPEVQDPCSCLSAYHEFARRYLLNFAQLLLTLATFGECETHR